MATHPRPEEIDLTLPRPSFAGAGSNLEFRGPLDRGEAIAFGTDRATGRPTGVSSNIAGVAESAGALGVPSATPPRPNLAQALEGAPRPVAQTAGALSAAQQGFLRGEGTTLSSGALETPAQKGLRREKERAGELESAKDFALQRAGAPARAAGAEARLTEGVRQEGRESLARQKGEIRSQLEQAKSGSREKIAALGNATKVAEGELDRASKSGDNEAKIAAERDIANLNNSARLEQLKLSNQFDLQSETNSFVSAAKLQAQREGTDVRLALLKAAADPFVDEDIRGAIIDQGVNNLIAAPEPVATETAVAATPTGVVAEETTVTTEGGDLDGDGTLSADETLFDNFANALKTATSEAKKMQIQDAMRQLKARILGQQ